MLDGVEELVLADFVGGGCFRDEGDGAGGFEDGVINFGERADSLAMCGGDEFGAGHKFLVEVIFLDATVTHDAGAAAFDEFFDAAMAVDESDDDIINEQEHGRAEEAAGDGVVVADDGVLDRV